MYSVAIEEFQVTVNMPTEHRSFMLDWQTGGLVEVVQPIKGLLRQFKRRKLSRRMKKQLHSKTFPAWIPKDIHTVYAYLHWLFVIRNRLLTFMYNTECEERIAHTLACMDEWEKKGFPDVLGNHA